ncbi:uncharacterized protein LOC119516503 [Choloepus didactylus]|uniref:uncharacterized protein LOC119516503 n=1 Tax=Choloepus didactylus TaxID=27675 RepID=UPI00189CFF81|nr:uncharacterized protein LOC119516503 [Choloepus didactylus]
MLAPDIPVLKEPKAFTLELITQEQEEERPCVGTLHWLSAGSMVSFALSAASAGSDERGDVRVRAAAAAFLCPAPKEPKRLRAVPAVKTSLCAGRRGDPGRRWRSKAGSAAGAACGLVTQRLCLVEDKARPLDVRIQLFRCYQMEMDGATLRDAFYNQLPSAALPGAGPVTRQLGPFPMGRCLGPARSQDRALSYLRSSATLRMRCLSEDSGLVEFGSLRSSVTDPDPCSGVEGFSMWRKDGRVWHLVLRFSPSQWEPLMACYPGDAWIPATMKGQRCPMGVLGCSVSVQNCLKTLEEMQIPRSHNPEVVSS